jgi:hypothetical protein
LNYLEGKTCDKKKFNKTKDKKTVSLMLANFYGKLAMVAERYPVFSVI